MTATKLLPKRFTLMLSGEDAYDLDDPQHMGPMSGLPHERFLLGEKLPAAPVLLLGQTNQAFDPDQSIACLQPVHLHATRDHLILMAQSQVDLTSEESANLLKVALPLIEEDFQHPLLFQGSREWFISAGPFASLATHSVDQSHGRNIDWWMPHDTHEVGLAKRWRKIQNEIQMLWHVDPTNEAREARGLPKINSIWLSGIGKLNAVEAPQVLKQSAVIYGGHPLLAGLAKHLGIPHQLTVDLSAMENAFAWLEDPAQLWPELLKALDTKALQEVEIIDFKKGAARRRVFTAKDLSTSAWAFWQKPKVLTWADISQS
ncbi:hypothetical protein [Polynucleobacter meluiroseus]|nr:hypothetical protein [Polynucleobacter meluiroseus]